MVLGLQLERTWVLSDILMCGVGNKDNKTFRCADSWLSFYCRGICRLIDWDGKGGGIERPCAMLSFSMSDKWNQEG